MISLALESDAGQAADTGSAVHMAARAFHTGCKGDVSASLEVMRRSLPKFPLADLGAAEQQFRCYAKDPRNKEAEIILCEAEHKIEVAPTIWVQGTLDQVRQERGGLVVDDIKTGGAYEGADMLPYHAAQLSAYMLMASDLLGERVRRCRIIRTKDYLKARPGPVFWEASWDYDSACRILEQVVAEVIRMRSNQVRITPSAEQCKYCPAGSLQNCIRRA